MVVAPPLVAVRRVFSLRFNARFVDDLGTWFNATFIDSIRTTKVPLHQGWLGLRLYGPRLLVMEKDRVVISV